MQAMWGSMKVFADRSGVRCCRWLKSLACAWFQVVGRLPLERQSWLAVESERRTMLLGIRKRRLGMAQKERGCSGDMAEFLGQTDGPEMAERRYRFS